MSATEKKTLKWFWNHYFKVQVVETEFILWGYGERDERYVGDMTGLGCHVAVAVTHIKLDRFDKPYEYHWKLPEHREGSSVSPSQEYGRVRSWGWRITSEDYIHSGSWYLAESREAAEEAAREYMRGEQKLVCAGLEVFDGRGGKVDEPCTGEWLDMNAEVLAWLEEREGR